jgi:hypothetical protein
MAASWRPDGGGSLREGTLGLKVQGPFDWQDHARELLEDGISELRDLVS